MSLDSGSLAEMPISPTSVFITGANRGIGLGLVKGFTKLPTPPTHIFATCRDLARTEASTRLSWVRAVGGVRLNYPPCITTPGVIEYLFVIGQVQTLCGETHK